MMMTTKTAKEVRLYYITLEEILYDYSKYISNYNLTETKLKLKQIQDSNDKLKEENNLLKINNKTLKNFVDNVKTKKNSYATHYATSKQYANQNAFKIGKSDNLKNNI